MTSGLEFTVCCSLLAAGPFTNILRYPGRGAPIALVSHRMQCIHFNPRRVTLAPGEPLAVFPNWGGFEGGRASSVSELGMVRNPSAVNPWVFWPLAIGNFPPVPCYCVAKSAPLALNSSSLAQDQK